MARKPNFLLIVTDQHRADHLGCYGSRDVHTPHIDALAHQGCRFEQFHVATPICQPNRASLMTGRLPSAHGLRLNGRELSLGERTFVDTLRESGWRTTLVGKAHLQNITVAPTAWPAPGQPRLAEARQAFPGRYGQEVWKRWEDDPAHELALPYYGFEEVSLSIGHGDDQHGHWRRWLRRQTPEADRLIGPANAIPTPGLALAALGQAWRTRLPEELHPTHWIASETCARLERFAQDDAPFFIQCSFPDPHHPYTPPGRYWDMLRPEDVTLPPGFHATPTNPPPPLQFMRALRQAQPGFRPAYGSFACSEQEAREAIALNHGNLACIDDGIGRVLDTLRRLGLEGDTVVMFTADHGDLMGERGLLFKGGLHYGALTRVPFIWRDPASPAAQAVSQALAQTIDIPATVLDRAGIAPTNGMQGRSLLPLMDGRADAVREALLIEEESQRRDFGFDRRVRMRTLRTATHRCTLWHGQAWGELVDLQQDPLELHNLWAEPQALGLRQQMVEQLAQAMLEGVDDSPYPGAAA